MFREKATLAFKSWFTCGSSILFELKFGDIGLFVERGKPDNWEKDIIVVEPRSTHEIDMILNKLIVKVLEVGNTADTPNPLDFYLY